MVVRLAFENVAIGSARAHRKSGIDQGVEVNALEVLANQSQPHVGAKVVSFSQEAQCHKNGG